MKSPLLAVLSAGLLLACNDPVQILPDDVEIRVLNPVEWPAQNLVLRSAAFARFPELPDIILGGVTLTAVRADDSTITVTLPDSAGTYDLSLTLRGGQRTGTVTVAGFQHRRDVLPLSGWALPVAPGAPVIVASASTSLIMLDLRNGISRATTVPHDAQCLLSPGAGTATGTAVVLSRSNAGCGPPTLWHVYPGTSPIDSIALGATGGRHLSWTRFSPTVWALGGNNGLWVYATGAPPRHDIMSEPERIILSPDGSLAVPLVLSASPGVPVYSSATGNPAFTVPVRAAMGAVFSPSGDTLFVAGYSPGPVRLIAMSPSGAVLAEEQDSAPQIFDLVLDSAAPYIYGLAYTEAGAAWMPIIHVYSRQTLKRLFTLRAPAPTGHCCALAQAQTTLSIDPATRRLYALTIHGWLGAETTPSTIWEFSVPPLHQSAVVLDGGAPDSQ